MSNFFKPLADALLAYGYTVKEEDGKKATMISGNGAEVTFEKAGDKKVTLCSKSSGWAVRQIADILQGNPCFVFVRNEDPKEDEAPWTIEFKESKIAHAEVVRNVLRG